MFDRGDGHHIGWEEVDWSDESDELDEELEDIADQAAVFGILAAHIQDRVQQLWPSQSDELNEEPEEPQEVDNPSNTSDHSYRLEAGGIADDIANEAFDSDIEVSLNNSEESPQPGGSKRKLRDLDEEDKDKEDRRNQFRWWDELAGSDSGNTSDSDSTDSVYVEPFEDPAEDTDVSAHMNAAFNQYTTEEDPLPGGSKKRPRGKDEEANEEEDKRSRKKVRPWQ